MIAEYLYSFEERKALIDMFCEPKTVMWFNEKETLEANKL